HAIPTHPIAMAVGDLVAVSRPARPVIGPAHQALAFQRRQATHAGRVLVVPTGQIAAWVRATAERAGSEKIVGFPVHAVARLARQQWASRHREVDASASSAVIKRGGKVLPRLAARRRMPAAAFADSQYLRGTARVSRTADNEHATASLGDSEPSRVQNSVGPPIPELPQSQQEVSEVSATI